MIWGCALLRDLWRARLTVHVMLNSSQCMGRRNKTTIQRVWWFCVKPPSSGAKFFTTWVCPAAVAGVCLHWKAESLTKQQWSICAGKTFLCSLWVLFAFSFFFNKPAKLRDIEKTDIGWNPNSTTIIRKFPIDFPRVSFHLRYGPLCILSWWYPNKMCFAYKSKHVFLSC